MTSSKTVSYRNRMSSNQGRQFENLIKLGCDHYRMKELAEIEKTPEPFIVTQILDRGKFKGRFTGKAQPDFQGTLANGRSIIFEAKCTSKDRIKQSVITDAQKDYLESHYQKGAKVGVCTNIGRTYAFVPWKIWRTMGERYGRQYMNESELKKYQVKTPGMICFLDYQ